MLARAAYDEDVYLARVLAGGAVGFLLKTEEAVTIMDAIQSGGLGIDRTCL
jgi:DNA-binding NarL/FixJ family response regulator